MYSLAETPLGKRRGCLPCVQVMMFSATLHSQDVKDIAQRVCHQPILIDLKVGSRYCHTSLDAITRLCFSTLAPGQSPCRSCCTEVDECQGFKRSEMALHVHAG